MPDLNIFEINHTEYGFEDSTARGSISTINGKIPSNASSSNKMATASDVSAISNKIGANNGIATLDANGKVPSSQLPSYVDDVLEYASLSNFPSTGETGKIYVAKDTNKTYRWGGSSYVEISASLAIGETADSAFAGNRGVACENAISAITSIPIENVRALLA